jgi:hypothetical protein
MLHLPKLFGDRQAGCLPGGLAALELTTSFSNPAFSRLCRTESASAGLADDHDGAVLEFIQLADALRQVASGILFGVAQAARPQIPSGMRTSKMVVLPDLSTVTASGSGFFAALGQHRPQQGATRQDHGDADKKNMVNKEFHSVPMV